MLHGGSGLDQSSRLTNPWGFTSMIWVCLSVFPRGMFRDVAVNHIANKKTKLLGLLAG